MSISGAGVHRFFAIRLKAPPRQGHILVSDSAGRVLHMSNSLAKRLNTTAQVRAQAAPGQHNGGRLPC